MTDLSQFPFHRLRAGAIVYHGHLNGLKPLSLDAPWRGPYDLPEPHTTIYVAMDASTVVDEMFGSAAGRSRMISEEQARRFSVAPFKMTRRFNLASIEHPKARASGFDGVTYRSSGDYSHTKEWARRLLEAGFDGVRFSSRKPDTSKTTLAALFLTGDPDERTLPMLPSGDPIPGMIAASEAGFSIEPWHLRSQMDLI